MRIAISGKIASGKSTVADHIAMYYGCEIMSLAAPIKELERIHSNTPKDRWPTSLLHISSMISNAVDMRVHYKEISDVLLDAFKKFEPRPGEKNRELLQYIGTEVVRAKLGDEVWCKYLGKQIELLERREDKALNIVVDDMRFYNEFEWLRSNGFLTIRLEIPEEIRMDRVRNIYGELPEDRLNHPSETDLDNHLHLFDLVVDNSKDLNVVLDDIYNFVKHRRRSA